MTHTPERGYSFEGQPTKIFSYGEATLAAYTKFYSPNLILKLGQRSLDLSNLPDDDPAKIGPEGQPLSVYIGTAGMYLSNYSREQHKLTFDIEEMFSPYFPFYLFEELHHARTNTAINQAMQQIPQMGLQGHLHRLPANVQDHLRTMDWHKRYPEKPTGFDLHYVSAHQMANEITAKRDALVELTQWCDGDFSRFGMQDNLLAEFVLLSLVGKVYDEQYLPYFGSDIARLPHYTDLNDLLRKLNQRYQLLIANRNVDNAGSFFPNGTVAQVIERLSV